MSITGVPPSRIDILEKKVKALAKLVLSQNQRITELQKVAEQLRLEVYHLHEKTGGIIPLRDK
jgi:uncharacterized coiled-coil protein SlyX